MAYTSVLRAARTKLLTPLRVCRSPYYSGHSVHSSSVPASASSCVPPAESPLPGQLRERISPKILKLCELARKHGYSWAWADMTCINKESSTELSEGINSMFRYYALSDVCFVYLADVPQSATRKGLWWSKWYTRGWTLQELLAPRLVVFLDEEWTVIGTKTDFAQTISTHTGIPERVLRFEQDMYKISVAARMSWASTRTTTRLEDEAYCLMGIFGINMPTLYGEGRNAFYRLQRKIMKASTDTSLFAWGEFEPENKKTTARPIGSFMECLFAPSPSCFRLCSDIVDDGPMTAVEVCRRPNFAPAPS